MNAPLQTVDVDIRHFHLFCGLGGGAKGFNKGSARVGNLRARFRCIGGIDVDPASIRDFTRAAGVPGTVLDLFSREQYAAFHGKAPPDGWREATTADLHRAAHGERPNIVFLSAPCKGFSGLLPEASSKTAKYQALNQLTLRGVFLMLEAWKNDPPELIVFENVPRIANRGRPLLNQIQALLRAYGYEVAETTHDCGHLGGLGQSRKRFLMVARHREKVPPYLYQPEKKRLRGVGEILERLPLPGDARGGPMHRMPALQWKTWVRLAFVEAGADWRSLNRLTVEDGVLRDFGIMPDGSWNGGVLGVHRWTDSSGVVTGRGSPTTGAFSVADPRGELLPRDGSYGVNGWEDSTGVITSQRSPGQGGFSVADPRVDGHDRSVQLGVRPWSNPTGVVTGQMFAGQGPNSVADPRPGLKPGAHQNIYRIVAWEKAAGAVTGATHTAGGAASVADPRGADGRHVNGKYRVTAFDEPAGAVIAASTTGNGAFVVADPRPPRPSNELHGKFHVTPFDEPSRAVIGGRENGAFVVADPRPTHGPNAHQNKMKVVEFGNPSGTVTGSDRVGSGALCVADPRPAGLNAKREAFSTGGHYGVVSWQDASGAVPAFAKNNNGPWSVADPRDASGDETLALPEPNDRLVAVIRALDGTWHRPFTTLELAALQSLFDPEEVFAPRPEHADKIKAWERSRFLLDGQSDSAWRERIGNAVPPDAAEAIASVMGTTLLLAMTGETFMLSSQSIWVQPLAIALAVDQRGNIPAEAIE